MATNPRAVGESTLAIAAELRAQRAARKLKQAEVSAATGIPVTTLSKLERGETAIDAEQIDTLARFYGMLGHELWSQAERNAALRDTETGQQVYLPDGSVDQSNTRGFRPSDGDIDELLSRPDNEGNAG